MTDFEIFVDCPPSGRMPSRRYKPSADWSFLEKVGQVHVSAATVKNAAQVLKDILRFVSSVHLYAQGEYFIARFKSMDAVTDDEVRREYQRLTNPKGTDIAVERMPAWYGRVTV